MTELIRDLLAVSALTAVAVGCWWERPSAALIVCGGIVLTGLIYRGGRE